MNNSFLTRGRYAKPALMVAALGFDPVAVVRRAVLSGRLPDPERCAVRRRPRVPLDPSVKAARKAARHLAYMRRARAANAARGLTQDGKPRIYQRRNLGTRKRKGYTARFMRLVRQSKATGPVRPYRKRA